MATQIMVNGWARLEASLPGDRGATLVEYALLVGLVALIVIAAMQNLGSNLSDQIDNIGNCVDDPNAAGCELP